MINFNLKLFINKIIKKQFIQKITKCLKGLLTSFT